MAGIKVGLLGFGTVGEGVYQAVQSHQKKLQDVLGKEVEIAGILVKNPNKQRAISQEVVVSDDIDRILDIPGLDLVVEAIIGVDPGYSYLTKAIEKGLHIITANKELMAHKGTELRKQAEKKQVRIEYEASVGGGIPVIGTLRHLLQINGVTRIEAILNGTSNFILTQMRENNLEFSKALYLAQEKGYAEADPGNDIDGWDAFYKMMILSDLLFGNQPDWNHVLRQGIRGINRDDLRAAETAGFRLKQVASLTVSGSGVEAGIEVSAIPDTHTLFAVEGVDNAVVLEGDLAGELQLRGPGAGAQPTASAIIQDLAAIYTTSATTVEKTEVIFQKRSHEIQDWLVVGKKRPYEPPELLESWKLPDGELVGRIQTDSVSLSALLEKYPEMRAFRIAGSFPSEVRFPDPVSLS